MSIAPPGPPIGPQQIVRVAGAAADQTDVLPVDQSFADLLWAQWDGDRLELDRSPPSNLPLEVDVRSLDPTVQEHESVAANAIRFDAKPVAAPFEVVEDRSSRISPQAPSGEETESLKLEGDGADTRGAVAGLRSAGAALASKSQVQAPGPATLSSQFRAERSDSGMLPPAPALSPRSSTFVHISHGTAETAPVSPRAPAASVARRLPATIAILPTEIIVTVRGISLTPFERDDLFASVRNLLVEHGLEGRAIRIQSRSRRNPQWP